ncbi:hypothetical protein [Halomarina oriensis]|uniref:Uncharacterized protein n=1 Tax=Halomarina oriensis TaxID=671145 RepID=A0A6B0GSY9_9EURY|nr:hypothetical protein [Halomarina oriensis]MWG36467.1 hypothetical protein [Halomarina oriensis]
MTLAFYRPGYSPLGERDVDIYAIGVTTLRTPRRAVKEGGSVAALLPFPDTYARIVDGIGHANRP